MAKFRFGHVTNSSSSSFVIAFKPTFNIAFNQKVELLLGSETDGTFEAERLSDEKIDDSLLEIFGYHSFETFVEQDSCNDLLIYNKFLGLSEDGYQIYYKTIDYEDDYIYDQLQELKCDNFIYYSY